MLLDDAILKRVVRDDAYATSRVQPTNRRLEAAFEHIELMVDLDANRLEAAFGRMPSVPTRRRRYTGFDRLDEVSRRLERRHLPTTHDLTRDLASELLLSINAKIRARSASV